MKETLQLSWFQYSAIDDAAFAVVAQADLAVGRVALGDSAAVSLVAKTNQKYLFTS